MIRLASNPKKPDATYNVVGGSMPDIVATLVSDSLRKSGRSIYLIDNPMYKVTIQTTPAGDKCSTVRNRLTDYKPGPLNEPAFSAAHSSDSLRRAGPCAAGPVFIGIAREYDR
jgi:hypothetical protein